MEFENRIRESEKKFMAEHGKPANYLLLSMYSYMKLKQEVAVRLQKSDLVWEDDFCHYEGLHVLVSQDQGFDDFVLCR